MRTLSRIPAPLKVFALALIIYSLSAQVWAHSISLAPHYAYLAQSLLLGHVDLIKLPPVTYDLLQHNGHWYVAGSPMPSILMLPFVAIFGVNFSDVLFSVVLGAITVALVYSLLGVFHHGPQSPTAIQQRIWADAEDTEKRSNALCALGSSAVISESTRRWITLLFAIGTPFWYLASLGTYWFTAHTVAVFFSVLAVREALTKQRWFISGLWLACAGFSRPTTLFLTPFFVLLITFHSSLFTRDALRALLAFLLAITLGLAAHALYNYARFKSFTDFGYAYVAGAPNITTVYAQYGGFNLHFLPCNLSVSLIAPPELNGAVPEFITRMCSYLLEGVNVSDTSALITPNPLGMSMFVVTPALLFLFAARKRGPIIISAWIGLLATMIPLWLYHNTGSLQFGYRYLFDAAPMWIILLAYAMRNMTWFKRGAILVSVAINLWGMMWMFEKLTGINWWSGL